MWPVPTTPTSKATYEKRNTAENPSTTGAEHHHSQLRYQTKQFIVHILVCYFQFNIIYVVFRKGKIIFELCIWLKIHILKSNKEMILPVLEFLVLLLSL